MPVGDSSIPRYICRCVWQSATCSVNSTLQVGGTIHKDVTQSSYWSPVWGSEQNQWWRELRLFTLRMKEVPITARAFPASHLTIHKNRHHSHTAPTQQLLECFAVLVTRTGAMGQGSLLVGGTPCLKVCVLSVKPSALHVSQKSFMRVNHCHSCHCAFMLNCIYAELAALHNPARGHEYS